MCAAGERGLFRFLRAEDVMPEQFAALPVRQSLDIVHGDGDLLPRSSN